MTDIGDQLWQQTKRNLDEGNFTALEELLDEAGVSIIDLLDTNGASQKYLEEALTWTCFVGHTDEARTLLDRGVDVSAGTSTGMAPFHWAANRGQLDVVGLLIERNAPLEQKNMYDGTVLNCTLWSAVHEYNDNHAEIIDALIRAGAEIEKGTEEWWEEQSVPSDRTKVLVRESLRSRRSD